MARQRNTTVTGCAFDEQTIDAVWNKAQTIKDKNPSVYRSDILGNTLSRSSYGNQTILGWEIDHIIPVSKNGTDDIENLQALNSAANAKKGDTYPWP